MKLFEKKLVVLSGAGISAESGVPTFRAADGLWEGHRIEDVASPEGWHKNPKLVLEFYNQRRKNILEVTPNNGHFFCKKLEELFDVTIITQNVDDLHERAGSSTIIHLHGEIWKARSTKSPRLIYPLKHWELKLGDLCELGSQLRPHIVWFGESVPMIEVAVKEISNADLVVVVGTSLQVYPAAGLLQYAPDNSKVYVVDPNLSQIPYHLSQDITFINEGAVKGMEILFHQLQETNF
ncbi:MAG: NAD-dependent deacylase [Cytophagales bacterium]